MLKEDYKEGDPIQERCSDYKPKEECCKQPTISYILQGWGWGWGWWSKEGHWNHTSFCNAMSHWFHGGRIRFGRW